jgi:hypothetical protein
MASALEKSTHVLLDKNDPLGMLGCIPSRMSPYNEQCRFGARQGIRAFGLDDVGHRPELCSEFRSESCS